MKPCQLTNIRMIFNFYEAYNVHEDGTIADLIITGAPRCYQPEFLEFYCVEHDCTFKQWRAVLGHMGETDMLK